MRKRGGSLDEARASGLGEELIFLVDTGYGWVVGEVVSVGEGRLDAGEGVFYIVSWRRFRVGKKNFSGGVFRESRHLWDAGTYLVDRVAEIGDYD